MAKIVTTLLVLLNPVLGFFQLPPDGPPALKNAANPAPLADEIYRLPIAESAFLAAQFLPIYPVRKWTVPDPPIAADAALVFETSHRLTLFQKNGVSQPRPIASLTKLMTALIIMENARLDEVFTVSKEAVATPGEMGGLFVGEKISVKNLLYALLVESSNDAAVALGENISAKTGQNFAELMNQKARELNLADTIFVDPSGLKPENRSSAWNLITLMEEVLKYPELIAMMQTSAIDATSEDRRFSHHFTSTNKLLGQIPEIIGGKTGYTEEAGNCMVLAVKSPNNEGFVISVVMGAQDRMAETAALISWTKTAFFW